MREIVYKMRGQVPETFFGLNILLSAFMAIPAMQQAATVQANFFLSFREMRHLLMFN